jgi:hypothetical protein
MSALRASAATGTPRIRPRVVVYHARPVAPEPHTLDAAVAFIRYHFGISLEHAIDVTVGRVLGSYILLERAEGKKKGAHL